jgi:hypothetical protein
MSKAIPKGSTCHYERDKDGQWWVVWGDKSGKSKCPISSSMEQGYQQGIKDVGNYMQDRITKASLTDEIVAIDLVHDLLRGRIPNENS